jgi:ABC-type multidrug transport system fused ATPase/permease subunit
MKTRKRITQDEAQFEGRFSPTLWNTLKQAYYEYRWPIGISLILGIFARTALLLNVNVMGLWVDSLVHPEKAHLAWDPLTVLMILTSIGFVLTAIFRVWFSRVSARAVSTIYDEVTYRTSRFPISFFDQNPVGRIVTRFSSDYNNVFRVFGGPLAEFITIVYDVLIIFVLILIAEPRLAVIVLIVLALNTWVYRRNLQKLRKARRDLSKSRALGISHFSESAQGVGTIRAYGKAEEFYGRFQTLNGTYLNHKQTTTNRVAKFGMQMGLVGGLSFILLAALSLWGVRGGWISVGAIGTTFAHLLLLSGLISAFFDWLSQFEEALTGVERLDHYLRKDLEPGASLPDSAHFVLATDTKRSSPPVKQAQTSGVIPSGAIEIRDLSLAYGANQPLVLQNLNLSVSSGKILGIAGKTGSGKSSLIQALYYLYPLDSGIISVGGLAPEFACQNRNDLKGLQITPSPLDLYRNQIALITQEPALFRGTLRENLTRSTECTDSQLLGALDHVQFRATKKLLDRQIEERGRNLSAGERQLLCMARCLLQSTPVAIFDEATSAVDPQSEEILNRATQEYFRGRTRILIAHRPTTLATCDEVALLEQGRIALIAKPDEVIRKLGH